MKHQRQTEVLSIGTGQYMFVFNSILNYNEFFRRLPVKKLNMEEGGSITLLTAIYYNQLRFFRIFYGPKAGINSP